MVEIKASKITRIVLIFENASDNVTFTFDIDGFANTFGGAKKLKGKVVTENDGFEAGVTLERTGFDFEAENFESGFVNTKNITISDEIIARKIAGNRGERRNGGSGINRFLNQFDGIFTKWRGGERFGGENGGNIGGFIRFLLKHQEGVVSFGLN